MSTIQEHTTPDGALRFVVSYEGSEIILGFDGYEWHTHGDILGAQQGLPQEVAVERFLSDILGNRAVIAISRIGGRIRDVWITDAPKEDLDLRDAEEQLEFRYWDGTSWQPTR